jgi:hypothetical protein
MVSAHENHFFITRIKSAVKPDFASRNNQTRVASILLYVEFQVIGRLP